MKTKVTRRMTFCAGHRIYNPDLSEAENYRIFGECANPNGHGHNFVLEVTIAGEINEETGMIINLKDMKSVMAEHVISRVDHKNLNKDVDFMDGIIPTTENFAQRIWDILDKVFTGGHLERIILRESENNFVEIDR